MMPNSRACSGVRKLSRSVDHLVIALAGVLGQHGVQAFLDAQHLAGVDVHIRGLALEAAQRLVDHDLAVGQRVAHALLPGSQQKCPHAGGPAHAHRADGRGDVTHGVVDGQTGGHGAAGRIDVQVDLLLRILGFQEQELGADKGGHSVVHFAAQQDDAILEQAGINIVGTFGTARGFDDHGDEGHENLSVS